MTFEVFSADELSSMRSTQVGAMQDSCVLQRYTPAPVDAYGVPDTTASNYVSGAEIACGFDPTGPREVKVGTQVEIGDARIRLPVTVELSNLDRVQITQRYGEPITPRVYQVIGDPERGATGLVVWLKASADGET